MDALIEAYEWGKENKGKVISSIGTALLINRIGYPIFDIGLMITGIVMEIRKKKKEDSYVGVKFNEE